MRACERARERTSVWAQVVSKGVNTLFTHSYNVCVYKVTSVLFLREVPQTIDDLADVQIESVDEGG